MNQLTPAVRIVPVAGEEDVQRCADIVGQLHDYFVRGHSEFLLRKSSGPLNEYRR